MGAENSSGVKLVVLRSFTVDGKAIGFDNFSTHRTNCWNSILLSLLMIWNYVRGLNCWVLPYQMFNLLVICMYALKQRSL